MPLRAQVSFNKERSFNILKKSSSFRKEKSEEPPDRKESKDDSSLKKVSSWRRNRNRDSSRGKESDDEEEITRWKHFRRKDRNSDAKDCKDNKEKEGNQLAIIANTLAASLSPFSFVGSRSPRGSRNNSPSPLRTPSPQPPPASTDHGYFSNLRQKKRERKLSGKRSPIPAVKIRHSWTGGESSCPSPIPSGYSSPRVSSPSLSPSFSPSESSSSFSDDESSRNKKRVNCGPKIEISVPCSSPSEDANLPPPVRTLPYCIEDGWELYHATDTVAKHRKTCQSCRCTRELHDVYHEDWVNVRERLGLGDALGRSNRELCLQEGYAWVPPGLMSEQVYDYMSCLPGHKVPRIGTPGEKYRERQLMLQLPKQDLALAFTRHVEPQYHTSYKDFIQARNDIALDLGIVKHNIPEDMVCRGCETIIPKGSVAVVAARLGDDAVYHPSCFTCNTCKEFLVDLVYCVWGDSIHCGRHYAEKLKPRCAACDELIFSGEYTKAMSKDWHSGHFCCWQCDDSLTGQRYVLKDDHPYCIKCYESIFANTCDDCSKIIGIDSKDLSYKDRHWHEKCFLCSKCQVSLVDKQFGSKQEKIFCGPCYDAQYASRCDSCGEVFRAGNKKMEYRQRQWHEKCFCCCVCKAAIGTRSFIPRDQDIYCAGCYEEKFATRCVKCSKIITTGGVTYKNEPWHRECFTCSNCDKPLAGQRFTSKDDKPYCAECFGELFAKRCTACTKPITGIGGTRFISFEDRHWHNDCFICASCKGSLVGKGFITDGADVLCPECAKQKIM